VSGKSDLIEMAAGVRQRRGKVEVLDPADFTTLGTCSWSPVDICRTFDRSAGLASWLAGGPGGERGAEDDDAPRQLLTCLLYGAANQGLSIGDAIDWLEDTSGTAL